MKFEKIFQKEWPMCYVASSLILDGVVCGAFASESHDTTGAAAFGPDLQETVLWEEPGGCMGIVQIPGKEEFLAIQKFYPVFQSEEAEIVWYYRQDGEWRRKAVLQVPFVHRIEILKENGNLYLLICKLCQSKKYVDDWSTAGSVLVCSLSLEIRAAGELKLILDGIYKNHGLVKLSGSNDKALIAHDGGIDELLMDEKGEWKLHRVFYEACSDAVVPVYTEDGRYEEMGVITPFHGDKFRILRREGDGWREIFSLSDKFGHGIWGGMLNGKACYLVGYRSGSRGIYCVETDQDKFAVTLVDTGAGNANLTVFRWKGKDYIGAANRESNFITIYGVHEDNE